MKAHIVMRSIVWNTPEIVKVFSDEGDALIHADHERSYADKVGGYVYWVDTWEME